jgi:hypothetical protein
VGLDRSMSNVSTGATEVLLARALPRTGSFAERLAA